MNDEETFEFEIGKGQQLREGTDVTIVSTGICTAEAIKAAEELEKEGISAAIVNIHTIKPIDKEAIIRAAKETGGIVVLEEHNIDGGVGSAVAEVLMDSGNGNVPFKRLAMPDVNATKVGCQAWMREQYGLGTADVINAVKNMVK